MDRWMRVSTDLAKQGLKPKQLLWGQPKSIFHVHREFQEGGPYHYSLMLLPQPGYQQGRSVNWADVQTGNVRSAFFPENVPQLFRVLPPLTGRRGESPLFLSTTLPPKLTSLLFPVFYLHGAGSSEEWIEASSTGSFPQSWGKWSARVMATFVNWRCGPLNPFCFQLWDLIFKI